MGDQPQEGASNDFGLESLADLYLHESASVNQLWTTYVVATFAGGTFAMTAGKDGGVPLLLAGAIGFSAFTIGHAFLLWSTLTRVKRAAADIRTLAGEAPKLETLEFLGRSVNRWAAFVYHGVIDACVLSAFAYRIAQWAPAPACPACLYSG
jgi:hypothetical protein